MRKKHIFLLILIIALTMTTFVGCTTTATSKYNREILDGSGFEYEDMEKLSEEWKVTSGGTNSSVFSLVDSAIKMDTSTVGYAAVSQTAYVKANSYYKVTYTYTSSSMSPMSEDKGYVGFYVGFQENINFNYGKDAIEHRNSTTGKSTVTYYFKTGSIKEVNICLYVGSKDYPVNVSNLTVYDLSLQRVQKATALNGSNDRELMTLTKDIYGRPSVLNSALIVLGVILTFALVYIGFYSISRYLSYRNKDKQENKFLTFLDKKKNAILCAVGIALLVRLLVSIAGAIAAAVSTVNFLGFDIQTMQKYGDWMAEYGTSYFFKYNPGAEFNPLALLLTYLIGGLTGGNVIWGAFLMKIFAMAADIGAVILIFKMSEKKLGNVGALILSSIYSLVPITFALSSKYGSLESITVLLILLTFYFILEKNYIKMAISYLFAFMFSATSWYLLPIVLMYIIYIMIKEKKMRWVVPVSLVVGIVTYFVVSLPFTVVQVGKGDVFNCFNLFIESAKGLQVYTANAFNFQGLLTNNFTEVSTESQFITILFVVFAIALVALAYFRNKNRLDLLLLGACYMTVLFMFTNNMLPYSMLIVLPMLMMYVGATKDKRILAVFALFAVTMFINNVYVYSIAGYTDAGITQLTKADSIVYWISSINIAITCYFIYVVFDIVVNKNFVIISKMDMPYYKYVDLKFKNFKISMHNFSQKTKVLFKKSEKKEDKK